MHNRALYGTLAAALLVCNILLILQNRGLRAEVASLRQQEVRLLEVPRGTRVPPVVGTSVTGDALSFSYPADQPTLIFSLSPRCFACEANWLRWKGFLESRERTGGAARIIFVDVSGTLDQGYVVAHGLSAYPVVARPDARTRVRYSLSVTPQLILVSPKGIVLQVWSGALDDTDYAEIRHSVKAATTS